MGDSEKDVEEIEFEGVGRGEFRWVSLAGLKELDEPGMDRIGVVCRIGVLGSKSVSNGGCGQRRQHRQKTGFRGEGQTFREEVSEAAKGWEVRLMMEWVGLIGMGSVLGEGVEIWG